MIRSLATTLTPFVESEKPELSPALGADFTKNRSSISRLRMIRQIPSIDVCVSVLAPFRRRRSKSRTETASATPRVRGDDPAMQTDRHHLRRRFAFGIEHLETVLEIAKELIASAEPLRIDEAHVEVPGISGFGHHTSSKRTFCAPCHSTALPSAGKFSRFEVSVMKWLPAS